MYVRATNTFNPPGVVLAGPERFANFDVEGDPDIYCAETDVENCFYRLLIDESYGRYFSLPGVTARDFDLAHVGGRVVDGSQLIYPCFAVLPIGHTWSLYLAQLTNEFQTQRVDELEGAVALKGDGANAVLHAHRQLAYYVCVDNIGVIGKGQSRVDSAIRAVARTLTDVGLKCHEPTPASKRCDGWVCASMLRPEASCRPLAAIGGYTGLLIGVSNIASSAGSSSRSS